MSDDATLKIGIETENTDGVIMDLSAIGNAGVAAAKSVSDGLSVALKELPKGTASAVATIEAEFAKIERFSRSLHEKSVPHGKDAQVEHLLKMRQLYEEYYEVVRRVQKAVESMRSSGVSDSDMPFRLRSLTEAAGDLRHVEGYFSKVEESIRLLSRSSEKYVPAVASDIKKIVQAQDEARKQILESLTESQKDQLAVFQKSFDDILATFKAFRLPKIQSTTDYSAEMANIEDFIKAWNAFKKVHKERVALSKEIPDFGDFGTGDALGEATMFIKEMEVKIKKFKALHSEMRDLEAGVAKSAPVMQRQESSYDTDSQNAYLDGLAKVEKAYRDIGQLKGDLFVDYAPHIEKVEKLRGAYRELVSLIEKNRGDSSIDIDSASGLLGNIVQHGKNLKKELQEISEFAEVRNYIETLGDASSMSAGDIDKLSESINEYDDAIKRALEGGKQPGTFDGLVDSLQHARSVLADLESLPSLSIDPIDVGEHVEQLNELRDAHTQLVDSLSTAGVDNLAESIDRYGEAVAGVSEYGFDVSESVQLLEDAGKGVSDFASQASDSLQEVEYATTKNIAEIKSYFNALKEFDKPIEFKGASAVAASINNLSDSFDKVDRRKILEFNRAIRDALDEFKVIGSFDSTDGIDGFIKKIEKLKFTFDRNLDFIDLDSAKQITAYIDEIIDAVEQFEGFDGSKFQDSILALRNIFDEYGNVMEAQRAISLGAAFDYKDQIESLRTLAEVKEGDLIATKEYNELSEQRFRQIDEGNEALERHVALHHDSVSSIETLADAQGSLSDSTSATETTWDKLAGTLSGVGNLLDEAGDVVEDTDKKFDKFSQTISGIAMKAVDGMKTKLREFNASLEENKKETESWYKAFDWTFKRLASAALIGVGTVGLKGLIVDAVSDFAEYESQMRMLEHQLIQTGRAVDFTKEALDEMAKSLEKSTLATAAQYREAQLIFMTYKNLDSSSLEAFLRIAADMTTIMGGDLATAAKQLGSALENPGEGMHFLTSAGMALTESQQNTLEGFIRMGQTANATAYMLEVLGAKMADVAGAKAAGLEGTINQLARAYKDLRITIGEESLPVVEKYVKALTAWIEVNERLISSRFKQYVDAVLRVLELLQPAMSIIGSIMMSLIDIVTSLPTWMQATGLIGALVFGRTGFAILGFLTKLSLSMFALSVVAGKAGALLGGSAFAAGATALTTMGAAAGALHAVLFVLLAKFAVVTVAIMAVVVAIAKYTQQVKAAKEATELYNSAMEKIATFEGFGGDEALKKLREELAVRKALLEEEKKRLGLGSVLGILWTERESEAIEGLKRSIMQIEREIEIRIGFLVDDNSAHAIAELMAEAERLKVHIAAVQKSLEVTSGDGLLSNWAEMDEARLGLLNAQLKLILQTLADLRASAKLDEKGFALWTEDDVKQLDSMKDALNQLTLSAERLKRLSEEDMMAGFSAWRDALPGNTDKAKLDQVTELWHKLWDAIYGARAERIADYNQGIQDRINAATLGAGELLKIERARAVEEAAINMASTSLVHQLYDTLESNRQRDHKDGLAARMATEKAAGDQFKLLAIEQAAAIKQAQKDGLDVEATRRFYEELIALRKQAFEQSGIDEYQSKIDSLTLDERALFEKEIEAAKKLYAGIQPVLVLIEQFAELQRQAFDKAAADKYAESIKDIETEYAELGKTILEVGLLRLAIWRDEKLSGIDDANEGAEELRRKIEAIYEARKGKLLEGVVDEIREVNVEFSAMGNLAQSAINDIIGSFTTLSGLMSEYTEKWKDLNEERKNVETLEGGVGNEEAAFEARAALTEKERELTLNSVQAQAAAYSNMFGTVGKMMKEGSKERETMHRIEMALAVVSIAMEMKKAAAAAITAIAVQATGGPYIGFVLAAAMAALMASIGAFSGSASASVPSGMEGSPTTGTVLGDSEASSESLQRSQDLIEELNDLQYVELTGIHDQMKDLNKNITGLVTGLVRAFGSFGEADFSGLGIGEEQNAYVSMLQGIRKDTDLAAKIFGDNIFSQVMAVPTQILEWLVGGILGGESKTKFYGAGLQIGKITFDEILNGIDASVTAYAVLVHEKSGALWGLAGGSVSYSEQHQPVGDDVTDMVNKMYKGILKQTYKFADAFGVPTEMIEGYAIKIQKLDLTGLTGDEITQKVSEWWSTLMDTIVDDLFGFNASEMGLENLIGKYQQIDEGLYETAVRLVGSVELVRGVIEMAGGSFEATGMAAVEMSQGILDAAGGIEEFTAGANAILDKMLTPLDKMEMQWTSFNTKWDALGFDAKLPKTSSEFLELLNSIDLTTKEGQKLYGVLVASAPALADFYKEIEKITGISGQSVGDALWESITQNQGGAEFIQGLEDNLREGVARAMVDAFAQSLYDAFLAPINAAFIEMMVPVIAGGVITGASISAAVDTMVAYFERVKELLQDPEFLGGLQSLLTAFQGLNLGGAGVSRGGGYTSAPSQPATQDRTAEILNKKLAIELQIAELMNDQNAIQEITNQQRAIELQALRDLNPELATLQAELYRLQDAAVKTAKELAHADWQQSLDGLSDFDRAMKDYGLNMDDVSAIVDWASNTSLEDFKSAIKDTGETSEYWYGVIGEGAQRLREDAEETARAMEEVAASFRSFVDQWTGTDSSSIGQLGLSDAELVAVGDYMVTLKEGTPEYISAMNALSGMGISVDDLGNAALSARANIEDWNASLKSIQQQALSLTSDAFQKQQDQQKKDLGLAVGAWLQEVFGLQHMNNMEFLNGLMELLATEGGVEYFINALSDITGALPEDIRDALGPFLDILRLILGESKTTATATNQTQNYSRQMVSYLRTMGGPEQEASLIDLLNTMNGLTEILTATQKLQIEKLYDNLRGANIKVPGFYATGNDWRAPMIEDRRFTDGYVPVGTPSLEHFAGGEEGLRAFFLEQISRNINQDGYIGAGGEPTERFEQWFESLITGWSGGGGFLDDHLGLTLEDMYRLGELMAQIKDVGEFINSDGSFNKENFSEMYDILRDQKPEDLVALYGDDTAKYLQDMIGLWERFGEEGSDTINELIQQFADWQKRLRNDDPLDSFRFERFTLGNDGEVGIMPERDMESWVDWAKVTDVNSFLDIAEWFGLSMQELMEIIDAANARIEAFANFQDKLNNVSIMDSFDFGTRGMEGWVDWAKVVGIDEFEATRIRLGLSFEDFVAILDAADQRIREIESKRLALSEQLADLLGDEAMAAQVLAQQRAIELAALHALDPALAILQEHIWGLQDAAEAAAKAAALLNQRLGLEHQLYTLLEDENALAGIVAQQRAIELDAMDESLRPLQERVWALQDEAEAIAKANTAVNDYLSRIKEEQALLEGAYNDAKTEYLRLLKEELQLIQERYDIARQALDKAIQKERELANARISAADTLDALINRIMGSAQSPVHSMEFFDARYAKLLDNMQNATTAEETSKAASELASFAPEYLDYAAAYGGDYLSLYNQVMEDLRDVEQYQRSEGERQIERLEEIEAILAESEDVLLSIDEALRDYQAAKTALDNNWYAEEIDKLERVEGQLDDIYTAQAAYYAAKIALDNSGYEAEIEFYEALLDSSQSIEALQAAALEAITLLRGDITALDPTTWIDPWPGIPGPIAQPDPWPGIPGPGMPGSPMIDDLLGYATGGIASGPFSGYPAILHGTEAIILLNGRAIPVEIRGNVGGGDIRVIVKIGDRELRDVTTEIIRTDPEAQHQIRRVANA